MSSAFQAEYVMIKVAIVEVCVGLGVELDAGEVTGFRVCAAELDERVDVGMPESVAVGVEGAAKSVGVSPAAVSVALDGADELPCVWLDAELVHAVNAPRTVMAAIAAVTVLYPPCEMAARRVKT